MPNKQAELLNNSGFVSYNNGEYDNALDDYNAALQLDKEYAVCFFNRGNVFLKKNEFKKALDDFSSAIDLSSNDSKTSAKALAGRARAYLNLKEFDKGIEDCNLAIKIEPFNVEYKNLLGELFIKKGESEMSSQPAAAAPKSKYMRYKNLLSEFNFTDEAKEIIDSNLQDYERLENSFDNSNAVSLQNWFEWIIKLPWKDTLQDENYTLSNAIKVLEEDHYGLDDVKTRIIEYLAVRKQKKNSPRGAIICLSGPPGVGKTSIGKSIARAMNKEFFRFSVGGAHDEAAIRGHRRAYIGSQPGQIIKGLATRKTKSLVCLIDEVDKMSSNGMQGDPYAALLEVLDPEQNNSFRDNFIDLPFDLSNVFFILTANDLDEIRRKSLPLLDRMEVIEIPGYIDEQKLHIAKKYLIPKSLEKNGLEKDQVSYSNEAILHIASAYEREPGVRQLEQNIDKIHRKLVRQIVDQKESGKGEEQIPTFVIDKPQIVEYLGGSMYGEIKNDVIQRVDRPGLAVGLAVSGLFGFPLLIETISVPGEEGYTITGNMKTVMIESVETAFSYARKFAIDHNYRERSWFKENHIHIHFPTASAKDGNSAGIAITTALLSLFKDKIITPKIVMTGEISLTGQVLAIGALREKIIGAKNNNAEHIIFPRQNLRDLDGTPDIVKEGLHFHPVERYEEVLALMLP